VGSRSRIIVAVAVLAFATAGCSLVATSDAEPPATGTGNPPEVMTRPVADYVDLAIGPCRRYAETVLAIYHDEGLGPDDPEDAYLEAARRRADDLAVATRRYRDELAAITPPDELAEVHGRIISLYDENAGVIDEWAAAVARGDAGEADRLQEASWELDGRIAELHESAGIPTSSCID
jgi:hypothetical protein